MRNSKTFARTTALLLSMFLEVFFPSTASAASAYDDNYRLTDNLYAGADFYQYQCENLDLTTDWSEYINNPPSFGGSSTELAAMQASFSEHSILATGVSANGTPYQAALICTRSPYTGQSRTI